jgi:hypothetical protein
MKDLRAMLETAQGTPTVVYFHCDAGMDRTGEVYGDYMMTCVRITNVHGFSRSSCPVLLLLFAARLW